MIRIVLILAFTGFNVVIDQVSKSLARFHLDYMVSTSYLSDIIRIVYVENTGVALSLGSDWPAEIRFLVFNILVSVILAGLAFYLFKTRNEQSRLKITAFTFILSGGIGNLIDRFMRDGAVTDFLNIGIGGIRTAVFNYADLCVTTGLVILLTLSILELRKPEQTTAPL